MNRAYYKKLEAKGKLHRKLNNLQEPNSSEVLMMFLGWLIGRPEEAIFSEKHEAGTAVELFNKFVTANMLPQIRENFPAGLEHPKE